MSESSQNLQSCRVPQGGQAIAGIGHNGGPKSAVAAMFALVGPRQIRAAIPYECGAPWVRFANMLELRRLAKLQGRIDRKKESLKYDQTEQKLIRDRCIKRMSRHRSMT